MTIGQNRLISLSAHHDERGAGWTEPVQQAIEVTARQGDAAGRWRPRVGVDEDSGARAGTRAA